VSASKNADKKAAEITKSKDKRVLDFIAFSNLVKITINKSFMKNIAETIYISNKRTPRLSSISCITSYGPVSPSNKTCKASRPPGCRG